MSIDICFDSEFCHEVCTKCNYKGECFGPLQLQRRHHYNSRGPESSHKTDAIEELKNAFELAERASPGISDLFVREIVQKLLPSVTETRIKSVMDKLTR